MLFLVFFLWHFVRPPGSPRPNSPVNLSRSQSATDVAPPIIVSPPDSNTNNNNNITNNDVIKSESPETEQKRISRSDLKRPNTISEVMKSENHQIIEQKQANKNELKKTGSIFPPDDGEENENQNTPPPEGGRKRTKTLGDYESVVVPVSSSEQNVFTRQLIGRLLGLIVRSNQYRLVTLQVCNVQMQNMTRV